MDVIGVMLAAAIAGIGSGIGVAIGQALYKAILEERIQKFLDKKHREEALKRLKDIDPAKSILFGNGYTKAQQPITPAANPETIVNKMLGK